MILTLDVTAPEAARLGSARRGVFSAEGGSIGRETSNDWVLPHSRVSARHAVISCVNAIFYIEDTSTNGVFVNSPKNRLVRGRPHALKSGDRIYIDPYEIEVSISSEQNDAALGPFADASRGYSPDPPFGASSPLGTDDPFMPQRFPSPAPRLPSSASVGPDAEPVTGQEVDPLKLLDPTPKHTPARKAASARDLGRSSPITGHYQPPAVLPSPASTQQPGAPLIPADYDPLAPDDPPDMTPPHLEAPPGAERPATSAPAAESTEAPISRVQVVPPAPSEPAPSELALSDRTAVPPEETVPKDALPKDALPKDALPKDALPKDALPKDALPKDALPKDALPQDALPQDALASRTSAKPDESDLAAVLAGAGLDGVRVTPELARSFGQILRVVVSGVMDVLRARQHIKDEFRMRTTQFRAADNNPLKFSVNVEDALHNLLVKRNPAYLGPVEAFEDAFDDLRNHQLAALAGMRVAFESMLAEFDPDRLQQQFDRQLKRGALLGMGAKLHYWDLYRDRRDAIAKDPDASFRKLFGEEFARAYEEQLSRLKAERHAREGVVREPRQRKQ
ncbi:MAG: type VI secretion system-associated FHA domain protein TagH [Luteitalea sp.]|nr:type VI secretion system-associated FHA domain protein TagH [Luteitalea sp.]